MRTDDILTGGVARLADASTDAVRVWERTGQLKARRIGHVRVFSRAKVIRFLRDRARRAKGGRQANSAVNR